jgi:signal peptidase I
MDPFSTGITIDNKSAKRDIGIITAVLESGNSVELPATGYSMFPTFIPGNRIVIDPLPAGVLPLPGSVLVFTENDLLVMHRLIEITPGNNEKLMFITRGDSRRESDKPFCRQQLLGEAVKYRGIKREHSVKKFIPGEWRYKLNQTLLWAYGRIKRVTGLL